MALPPGVPPHDAPGRFGMNAHVSLPLSVPSASSEQAGDVVVDGLQQDFSAAALLVHNRSYTSPRYQLHALQVEQSPMFSCEPDVSSVNTSPYSEPSAFTGGITSSANLTNL